MRDETLLGPWVRRFLLEHLVAERNLSRNTQASYRDALALLLPELPYESLAEINILATSKSN
jgi:site-specific recombinase XerD